MYIYRSGVAMKFDAGNKGSYFYGSLMYSTK